MITCDLILRWPITDPFSFGDLVAEATTQVQRMAVDHHAYIDGAVAWGIDEPGGWVGREGPFGTLVAVVPVRVAAAGRVEGYYWHVNTATEPCPPCVAARDRAVAAAVAA